VRVLGDGVGWEMVLPMFEGWVWGWGRMLGWELHNEQWLGIMHCPDCDVEVMRTVANCLRHLVHTSSEQII